MLSVNVLEKCRRISNIELHYACISSKKHSVVLCVCDNADMFSREVLKRLLVADDGFAPILSVALSLDNCGLKIQAVSLK